MSNDGERDPRFESSFMDDYFAEADEHIAALRRLLLVLEGAIGGALPPAVLEELFRRCHSMKGISAMVELHDAEGLAHQMESGLRALRQGEIALTTAGFDALLGGTNALEAVVMARRTGQPTASIDSAKTALQTLASGAAIPLAPERAALPGVAETSANARRWKVRFVPSPALIERGVKVDTIRARLMELGAILGVAPTVLSEGGIAFDFDVQTDNEVGLATLDAVGVSYEPLTRNTDAIGHAAASSQRPLEMAAAAPTNFVRVDLARLDDLMRLAGDLVVTRSRLTDTLHRAERQIPARELRTLQQHDDLLERQLRDLRDAIMRVRLVPIGEVFRRMPFVVRDLARDSGKRVQLQIAGQGTEIDKFLIERMMDPILHLVRNAVSHGIETPERRATVGKADEGTIALRASTAGEYVIIEVSDDGQGLDLDAIATRADARGLYTPDGTVDTRTLLDIICASGFSTRHEADRASGRGVGMAVVRAAVQELGGTLDVATAPGRGTTFTLTVPVTLVITDALIAHVAEQRFAMPQTAVTEVIEVNTSDIRAIERNELITYRGRALPVVRLARVFRINGLERPRLHAIVVGSGSNALGLLVDRIGGHREIVVKPVTDPLIRVPGVTGATELGDGRLVLILDALALGRELRTRSLVSPGVTA